MEKSYAVAIALLIAACTQQPPKPTQTPNINLAGFPKSYQDGYRDGCTTAQSLLSKKDQTRYKSDFQYMTGWQDGYSVCRNR